jgi:hypothetical protein
MDAHRITFVLFVLVALSTVRPAFACSCFRRDPAIPPTEHVVILAKVTKLATKPIGAGLWTATIVVLKSWNGPWLANATMQVQTPGPSGPCGFFIHVGDEMLVYSNDPQMMNLGLCNTVRGEDVKPYIQTLERSAGVPELLRPK